MLRYRADWLTCCYMGAATAVLLVQWNLDRFSVVLYGLQLALAFAVSIMHHNHRHLALWRSDCLNRITNYWFTVFQGHPGFVFDLCHNDNHHRHCNSHHDYTHTYRYRDDNSLLGLLIHPFESVVTLAPIVIEHLKVLRNERPSAWYAIRRQYHWLALWIGGALVLDWSKALVYIVVPQFVALFWLLGANYLQHAHTNETERFSASRNFLGAVNLLCFNIGLHTAHHLGGARHWSELPDVHAQIAHRINPALLEAGLLRYGLRVFVLALFVPALRSRPLRSSDPSAGA